MPKEKWFGKKKSYTDAELIEGIKLGGIVRERCMTYLHQTYMSYLYERLPQRYKLSVEDVKDAYSDSLIKLTDQIIADKFRGESKISTYFYRIFFNACVDKMRSNNAKSRKVDWVYEFPQLPDPARDIIQKLYIQEDVEELKGYLNLIGERCRKILWYSSYWGYTHKEIAEKMGFKNAQSVTTQRYSCLARLHKVIKKTKDAQKGNKSSSNN